MRIITSLLTLILGSQQSFGMEIYECYDKVLKNSVYIENATADRLCRENIKLAFCTINTNNKSPANEIDIITSERLCRKGIAKRVLTILKKTVEVIDAERLVEEDYTLALCTVNALNQNTELSSVIAERVCRKKITKCFLDTLEKDIYITQEKAEENCSRGRSNSINSPFQEIIHAEDSIAPISY